MKTVLLLISLLLAANSAYAHRASDSYLRLQAEGRQLTGQWAIGLRDLDLAIGLDGNNDGQITWAELRDRYPDVLDYALAHLHIDNVGVKSTDGHMNGRTDGYRDACTVAPTTRQVEHLSDGAYASFGITAQCNAAVQTLAVDYRLFFDLDPQHRGLLQLDSAAGQHSRIFSPAEPVHQLNLLATDRRGQFGDYFRSGVWHIASGFDHILFVITLLLPAVLMRRHGVWRISPSFTPACLDTCQVITAFTLAHSCTLALASLAVVRPPGALVEAGIAASVLIAALHNLRPFLPGRRWVFAFGFGLIHGFGFAAVLGDVGLHHESLLLSLLGFNLGVEAGQLALVALLLPLLYGLRTTRWYRPLVHIGGSLACSALAVIWLVERLSTQAGS